MIGKTGESQTVQSKVGKKLAEVNAAVAVAAAVEALVVAGCMCCNVVRGEKVWSVVDLGSCKLSLFSNIVCRQC